jgi:hypothetical protein
MNDVARAKVDHKCCWLVFKTARSIRRTVRARRPQTHAARASQTHRHLGIVRSEPGRVSHPIFKELSSTQHSAFSIQPDRTAVVVAVQAHQQSVWLIADC